MPASPYRPMLATSTDDLPNGAEWLYELKLDGYRTLGEVTDGRACLWSRRGVDMSERFARVAAALPAAVGGHACVVDGEVCALDARGHPSFSLLQASDGELVVYLFDLLELDGAPLLSRPLERRRAALEDLVRPGGAIRLSHAYDDGPGLLQLAARETLEGVVAKRRGSLYRPGRRSRDWMKLKLRAEGTFTIAGYTRGAGGRARFGALVLAEHADGGLRWVGEVGTGFSDGEIDRLLAALQPLRRTAPTVDRDGRGTVTWVEPRLRCLVEYAERTAAGHLRAPVYISMAGRARAPRVEPVNPDKVFFPEDGITKRDLLEYYRRVAPVLLPHLRDRPFTMLRQPDGIHGKRFFQKDAPSHTPPWIRTYRQGDVRYLLLNDVDSLLWAINMGCIDLHAWASRVDRPDRPDWVMFDLDPAEGTPFSVVVEVALLVRHALETLGLETVPKTSGSKGLHVLVPIARRHDQQEVRAFAASLARVLAETAPELITTAWRRRERHGVLIDANQNGIGRTTAAVYSVRPLPGARVSTPLTWAEVGSRLDPSRFTMATVLRRVSSRGDLSATLLSGRQRLPRL